MLLEEAKKVYLSSLEAHFKSKTKDTVFHESTQDFYEELFTIFHDISEKEEDLKEKNTEDMQSLKNKLYNEIEGLKISFEKEIKKGLPLGKDNLYRGIVDKLDFMCGNARAFTTDDEEIQEALESLANNVEENDNNMESKNESDNELE